MQDDDVGRDQAFFGIGDVGIFVDAVHHLFLVRALHQFTLVARGIDRLRGRERDTRGVFRTHVRVLTDRRERRSDDLLRHALVADAGDVVHAHAFRAFGDVQVFAAQLDAVGDAGAVLVRRRQFLAAILVLFEPVRIGVAVQIAADHGLRFVPLGDLHRADAAVFADPCVVADEVDELRAEQQRLRHDGVVVVVLGDVAVVAILGFGLAFGVRIVRREGLRRVAG